MDKFEKYCAYRKLDVEKRIAYTKEKLASIIYQTLQQSTVEAYICGGADGADLWAAYEVLKFKALGYTNARLLIALPTADYYTLGYTQYHTVFNNADAIFTVSEGRFSKAKAFIRDGWIVDHSAVLAAVWEGNQEGSTYYTVNYALGRNKPIWMVDYVAKEEFVR